tara:strand:- start:925 stop:1038 length:114 start_codon:yes stop_codon:yes gene_type:complete
MSKERLRRIRLEIGERLLVLGILTLVCATIIVVALNK